jgi:UDP-N-acetylglucosamine acyltransferase
VIDPRAIIDPASKIGEGVTIGPYSIIGPHVEIGEGTWVGPHVVINGHTKIGKHNRIFQFASVGEVPQDKKYANEPTRLEIGDHNVIREGVTIHLGTIQDQSLTKIGNHNLLMAYVHVAHDCIIGNHNIFANNASLAGHVHTADFVIMSGFCGVHQFCKIGAHAFIAHGSLISKDVPPFVMVTGGAETTVRGINVEGLKRRGFSPEGLRGIRQAYKIIYRQGLTVTEALEQLDILVRECKEVQPFIDFLKLSERGIVR